MKITGPKPPITPPTDETIEPAGKSRATRAGGPGFAEALSKPEASGAANAGAPGAVGGLAAELRAGSVTPEQAVEQLIEKAVAARVPPTAPDGVRDQVREALREAMASDPMLVERLKRIGELR